MEKSNEIKLYSPEAELTVNTDVARPARKITKPYVFYCVMTLSVMLFALAFAASELFSIFFSEGYPGQMLMTKFFGVQASPDKSFKEILLEQSFADLSLKGKKETQTNASEPSQGTDIPTDNSITVPDKEHDTTGRNPLPSEPPATENIYAYDPSAIPEGMCGIIPMDLSLSEYGNDYIHDSSVLDPRPESLEKYDFSVDTDAIFPENAPIVLIVHTHGSEAYTDAGISFYDPSKEVSRSYDTDVNVVSLGRLFAERLNSDGIPTIHVDTMHDASSYSGAYSASAATIVKYLEKYPSIQYVIDIHRDAVVKSTGELVRPIALSDGEKTAQLMCVVGTGENGTKCSNWESNLALAQKFRLLLNDENANLCRPTCLRDSSYNQQYAVNSMLIEIGAAGNTLAEAQNAAILAAKAFSSIIKG